MRTLVVIHSLKMGGMERVAVNLADAFADEGHESHLLSCRNRPNDLAPRILQCSCTTSISSRR